MNIRNRVENLEKDILSKYAALVINTKGRAYNIIECSIRTDYQRDRDRIIHSKSFRRLKHKTQVFIAPEGDHYRTRLTHTLEVAQIGRTIARALRLNEDLTEAIALGHDLGHTPFGHAGESILNEICPHGFKHYDQSLRVVEVLENDGKGMNLTFEVKDGIKNHTGKSLACTLEGIIIKYADRIAYINHDIDDALRASVINLENIPKEYLDVLGVTHGERINTMIVDIINNSMDKPQIIMSEKVNNAMLGLREYMFENVYIGSTAKNEELKVKDMISYLYKYFVNNPEKLPEFIKNQVREYDIYKAVCDYIAGMTDRYAIYKFSNIFVPKSWQKM